MCLSLLFISYVYLTAPCIYPWSVSLTPYPWHPCVIYYPSIDIFHHKYPTRGPHKHRTDALHTDAVHICIHAYLWLSSQDIMVRTQSGSLGLEKPTHRLCANNSNDHWPEQIVPVYIQNGCLYKSIYTSMTSNNWWLVLEKVLHTYDRHKDYCQLCPMLHVSLLRKLLNVRGPNYSGPIWSISWLLVPWLISSGMDK